MQRLENQTLQKFIDELVEAFKIENKEKKEQREFDIPFLISTLYQSFKNEDNTKTYFHFVEDLDFYSDYNIDVVDSANDYNGIVDVYINLVKFTEEEYGMPLYPSYDYKISFEFEDRHWGYCECTPDMPDYREDKQCCGHGCDATFCEFNLYKIMKVTHGFWKGDKHDYWDFEDDFYKTDEELLLKKQEEDKKREIEMCKKYIEEYTKKLTELEGKQ